MKSVLLMTLMAVAAASAAPELWDADAARVQATDARTANETKALLDETPFLPEAALRQRVQRVLDDDALPLPARERIVRDYAFALREVSPDAVAWQILDELTTVESRVRVAHPEGRGGRGVPLYDIASAAGGTLNLWTRVNARDRVRHALERKSTAEAKNLIVELAKSGHPQQLAGASEAIAAGTYGELMAWLATNIAEHPELSPILYAAATKRGDAQLLERVIFDSAGPWPARAAAEISERLGGAAAIDLLQRVAADAPPAIASIALVQLGEHFGSEPGIRALLVDQLGDAALGASAALGLARVDDDAVIDVLGLLASQAKADGVSRNARLALRLHPSPRATALSRELER